MPAASFCAHNFYTFGNISLFMHFLALWNEWDHTTSVIAGLAQQSEPCCSSVRGAAGFESWQHVFSWQNFSFCSFFLPDCFASAIFLLNDYNSAKFSWFQQLFRYPLQRLHLHFQSLRYQWDEQPPWARRRRFDSYPWLLPHIFPSHAQSAFLTLFSLSNKAVFSKHFSFYTSFQQIVVLLLHFSTTNANSSSVKTLFLNCGLLAKCKYGQKGQILLKYWIF